MKLLFSRRNVLALFTACMAPFKAFGTPAWRRNYKAPPPGAINIWGPVDTFVKDFKDPSSTKLCKVFFQSPRPDTRTFGTVILGTPGGLGIESEHRELSMGTLRTRLNLKLQIAVMGQSPIPPRSPAVEAFLRKPFPERPVRRVTNLHAPPLSKEILSFLVEKWPTRPKIV